MLEPDRERRLVARFREGDPRAMEILFDHYVDRSLGFAVRLCDRREDAEDVVQDAFLRAFSKCRQIRDDSVRFGPWLFAIIRSIAADRRRQLRFPEVSFDDPRASSVAGPSESDWFEAQRTRELLSALERLPEEQQVALTLCDLEELPHGEVAEVLGKSLAATKSLLYRGRRALHKELVRREES